MSGSLFCPQCGTQLAAQWRFCGSCGEQAPSQPAPPAPPSQPSPETSVPPAAPPVAPPTAPAAVPPTPPPGVPAQPHSTPEWVAVSGGSPLVDAVQDWARRHRIERARFAAGDWAGAALAAAAGIGTMLAVSVICVLLIGAGHLSVGQVIALSAMATALAAGGSLTVDTSGSTGLFANDASGTVSFLPVLITVLGLAALTSVFLSRLRRHGAPTLLDVGFQAARLWLLFLGGLLAVSLAGRLNAGGTAPDSESLGSVNVSASTHISSTLFFGTCWLLLALCVAVAWRLPGLLPPRLRGWRDAAVTPAVGALTMLMLSWTVAFVVLLVAAAAAGSNSGSANSLDSGGPPLAVIVGAVLLLVPSALLAASGFALGVPAVTNIPLPGQLGSHGTITLLDATDSDVAFWFVPLVAALTVLVGGVIAALHAPSPTQARRTGWRMGIAMAALLVTIALNTAATSTGATGATSGAEAEFHLDFFLAAVLGLLWGGLGGWLGALLAPHLPGPVIAGVRARVERTRRQEQGSI